MQGFLGGRAYTKRIIWVYDLSNLGTPQFVKKVPLITTPSDGFDTAMRILGNRLHVALGRRGYILLDITSPANPTILGTYPLYEMEAEDIAVDGPNAYIAIKSWCGFNEVRVLNISNPSQIRQVATIDGVSSIWQIIVDNGYVYTAEERGGLRIREALPLSKGLLGWLIR